MIFYTYDADGVRIQERAKIRRAQTREEALGETRLYYERSDFDVVDLERGSFGDCWIRLLSRPHPADIALWEKQAGALHVAPPRHHPGGKAWWVTPLADVFVPVLKERASCV